MLYNKDGSANINSDRNIQVMNFFRTLKDEGCLPDGIENYSGDDATKLFNAGKAGIVIKSCGDYKNARTKDGFTADQVCVLPPLKSPSGVQKEQLCVNGYLVFEQSQHKEEAMKFLKWYSENSQDLWVSGGQDGYPARLSFMNELDEFQKDYRQDVIKTVLNKSITLCYPLISGVPSASAAEGQKYDMICMQAALTMDEAGMKKTLEDLQAEFQKTIEDQEDVYKRQGYHYGCGIWGEVRPLMNAFRDRVEAFPDTFRQRLSEPKLKDFAVGGDLYKKDRKPEIDADLKPWVNRKSLFLEFEGPLGAGLFTPQLAQEVRAGFEAMAQWYRFVMGI